MAVTVRFPFFDAEVTDRSEWRLLELRIPEGTLEEIAELTRQMAEQQIEYLNGLYGPDWTPGSLEYVPFHALAAARAAVEDVGGEILAVDQPPDPPPGAIL